MILCLRIRLNHYFMAVRTYCDACEVEIKKGDDVASIMSIEKQYTLNSTEAQGQEGQVVQITRLACGKCFKKIKKIFEDAKKV